MKPTTGEQIYFIGYLFVPLLIGAVFLWTCFRKHDRRKFQIRITDLWALSIGISPGLFLIVESNRDQLMIAASVLAGQVVGAFWAHLRNEASRNSSSKYRSVLAGTKIIVGALLGMLLPFIGGAAVLVFVAIGLRNPAWLYSIPWINFESVKGTEND